jgi:hypothetical protein
MTAQWAVVLLQEHIFMTLPDAATVQSWPVEQVAELAPQTVIYAPGGTRRQAVLAGLRPDDDTYAAWSRQQMLTSLEQLFRFGVEHVVVNVLRPAQVAEVGPYRERLFSWLHEGLGGPQALADYEARGWRARVMGASGVSQLEALKEHLLAQSNPATYRHTVWFYLCVTIDSVFVDIANAMHQANETTQSAAISALYGEAIPPATLLLGFGKPLVAFDMILLDATARL